MTNAVPFSVSYHQSHIFTIRQIPQMVMVFGQTCWLYCLSPSITANFASEICSILSFVIQSFLLQSFGIQSFIKQYFVYGVIQPFVILTVIVMQDFAPIWYRKVVERFTIYRGRPSVLSLSSNPGCLVPTLL